MYGGYGGGKPAHRAVAARAAPVDRHEGPDRDDAAGRIAVAIAESRAVGEPGIVYLEPALGRVAGEEDEVLIGTEADLGHHRPPGRELGPDNAQVWTKPTGEGDPTSGVAGDGIPDELVIVCVAAV